MRRCLVGVHAFFHSFKRPSGAGLVRAPQGFLFLGPSGSCVSTLCFLSPFRPDQRISVDNGATRTLKKPASYVLRDVLPLHRPLREISSRLSPVLSRKRLAALGPLYSSSSRPKILGIACAPHSPVEGRGSRLSFHRPVRHTSSIRIPLSIGICLALKRCEYPLSPTSLRGMTGGFSQSLFSSAGIRAPPPSPSSFRSMTVAPSGLDTC